MRNNRLLLCLNLAGYLGASRGPDSQCACLLIIPESLAEDINKIMQSAIPIQLPSQ